MKQFYKVFTLSLGLLLVVSCDEDVEPIDKSLIEPDPTEVIVEGEYKMAAFYTEIATDVNSDGIFSANQMTETECYNDNYLTLNANGSFTLTNNKPVIVVVETVEVLECDSEAQISGNWVLEGNDLLLTYSTGGESHEDHLILSNEVISYKKEDQELVTTIGGDLQNITSNVDMVFTKQ